jgi:hypothetical protein
MSDPMSNPPGARMTKRMKLHALAGLALLALLGACGGEGGVDSGGTGATPSVSSGPITGFGSVIVGGVRYDDSAAAVEDEDGLPRSRDELRLGMTVEIDADAIATDATARARLIRLGTELAGFVTAVEPAGQAFTVLGQRVEVDGNTVFDERLPAGAGDLTGLLGERVDVYAEFDAALQRYRATRVEPGAAGRGLRLRGPLEEVSPLLRRLRIGGVNYCYDRADGVPANLAAGTWVRLQLELELTARPGCGAWEVRRFALALRDWADADEVRIEGLVTARGSGSAFVVNGRLVDGSGASLPAGLVAGARVEVRGTQRAGVLRASRVELRSDDEQRERGFELRGAISSVVPAEGRFRLRGVTVTTARPGLELRGGTLADLVAGRRVEVRGLLAPDRRTLEATRIDFE